MIQQFDGGRRMRAKTYTHGVSFSTTKQMYEAIKKASHEQSIDMSDFLRDLIEDYFRDKNNEEPVIPRNWQKEG
jgi:hypothetical protein